MCALKLENTPKVAAPVRSNDRAFNYDPIASWSTATVTKFPDGMPAHKTSLARSYGVFRMLTATALAYATTPDANNYAPSEEANALVSSELATAQKSDEPTTLAPAPLKASPVAVTWSPSKGTAESRVVIWLTLTKFGEVGVEGDPIELSFIFPGTTNVAIFENIPGNINIDARVGRAVPGTDPNTPTSKAFALATNQPDTAWDLLGPASANRTFPNPVLPPTKGVTASGYTVENVDAYLEARGFPAEPAAAPKVD